MSGLTAQETFHGTGRWRMWAHRPGMPPTEITYVRGIPTQLDEWSWSDPFGPESAGLTFSGLTMYDTPGQGDLEWLAPEVNVDIEWEGPIPAGYPFDRVVWEGYMLPFEYSQESISVTLVGAMFQLDNYLAKPEYAASPIPFEVAIARQWVDRPDLRLSPLEVRFPDFWSRRYAAKAQEFASLIPTGVSPGQLWTGAVTRETGAWDKALTSYIQTLLASLYTERGRFTIDLFPGRRPVFLHRDQLRSETPSTVSIEPTQPGIAVSLSEDWSQSANCWYGQTTGLSGESYSGQQVVGDGLRTTYVPLAASRQVHPTEDRNTWLDLSRMRREQQLQAVEGLQVDELIRVGNNALQTNADPGVTGTITLESDPKMTSGGVVPRQLLRAGMDVVLRGFKGDPDGILLHITKSSYETENDAVTLTVDSKFRDRLTVDEVRLRGRDALAQPKSLIAGRVQPLVNDSLVPWNYAAGSGYIPSGPNTGNARRLFEDMPPRIQFPYEEWTRQRPPKSRSWRSCYIDIGPAVLTNADENWAFVTNRGGGSADARFGIPVRMAQAGDVRLLQIAAYDEDGFVMPVGFHFSIYYQRNVNVAAMPVLPSRPKGTLYNARQHFPFFPGAFENVSEAGVQRGTETPVSVQTAGLIRGWGTDKVRAGYWPGSSAAGDKPTGLLVDEGTWNWDTLGQQGGEAQINPFSANQVSQTAGFLYVMIYCDRQLDRPVYFMGRIFRVEPGSRN